MPNKDTLATNDDLVTRLRSEQTDISDCELMNRLTHEAADEIERLRTTVRDVIRYVYEFEAKADLENGSDLRVLVQLSAIRQDLQAALGQ